MTTVLSAPHSAISLISVYERPDRHRLLYDLLAERDETVNISHREMPAWDKHVEFVESCPYKQWFFILDNERVVGACYLSRQNEIGIFIFRAEQSKGYGSAGIEAIIERCGKRRYLANINPRNERSVALFARLGFRPISHTYECF